VVYLLAVGVAAHALDAMGPNKPWGNLLSHRQLTWLAVGGLVPALAIGLYYALSVAPLLIPLGLGELFFLLAYNLELFGGRFHKDSWFAFSWGFLPVLAGYVVQTDSLSLASLVGGFFGLFTAFVEISASRPYKSLKRQPGGATAPVTYRLESILKGVVATVLTVAILLLVHAVYG